MKKLLAPAVTGILAILGAVPAIHADTYFQWSGNGADDNFSTAANWTWNQAPTGNLWAYEHLFFEALPGTVSNDLVGASYQELFFSDGSYNYMGNTADIAQLTLSVRNANASSLWVGADIRGADVFFDYDDFRTDQSTPADLHFGVGSEIRLTSTTSNRFSTYGYGAFQNRVVLAGTNGRIVADGPAEAWIGGATLGLNGGNEAGVSGRVGSNVHVYLDQGSQLKLNAYAGADAAFTETISQLTVVGSAIVNVDGASGAHDTILSIPADISSGGLALYNASNGVLGAESGPAPRIMLQGQNSTSFLGSQQFMLNGNVNWGGGFAKYEFAAYDATRGVISATTLNNPTNLATAAVTDVVQIDMANPAALSDDPEDTRNYKLTGDATVRALAFNGDLLYSHVEGQPGPPATLTLEHLLLTHDTAAVAVNLNFGGAAGTITTENWFQNHFPEVDVLAGIAGTNSLTFRGYGELNYRAAASFSGELAVAGGYLNISDAGSFNQVGTIKLGAEGGILSSLELYGVDNTGSVPVRVNRLKDDALISVKGNSEMNLESDSEGATSMTEQVGTIIVSGAGTEFYLSVQAGDLDTHTAASAAGWEVSSLAFAASASNSSISLAAFGEGNTITINGGPIMLQNGNSLSVRQESGGRVITGGIGTTADSTSTFYLSGQIEGNVDLQGGIFSLTEAKSSIVGNFTMGTGLQTTLALPSLTEDTAFRLFALEEVPPILFIDGDLTLGGTIHVSQNGAFESGSWLVFQYSGEFTELAWTVEGLDGNYTLTVDELTQSVYVNAVPEPASIALTALGLGILLWRKRQGRGVGGHRQP